VIIDIIVRRGAEVPTYLRSKSEERRAIVVDEATRGLSIVGTLPASRKE
jgi:hypothetical protein